MIREISLLVLLIRAELTLRLARAWFWLVRVPWLLLRSAFQKQNWPHRKSVFLHTLDVVRAVWRRRREFTQLGVSWKHALQAALLHDLGKPQVAKRQRKGRGRGFRKNSWYFPEHELAIANKVAGFVHPHVWYLVRYHHLPISQWEWTSEQEVAQALYGSGLDLRWGKILTLFAECDGEGLAEDFTPDNVQQFKELLDVVERESLFATCRICGRWSPTFQCETQQGSDYRTACCEL